MIFFNKTSWKFLGIFTAIVAVSLVIIYTAAFFNPEVRKEMAAEVYAEKYIEDLREKYKNDTYGGETPEETLTLFTQALEDGDVELASKYFIVEKQEKMKEELNIEKENDVLKLIIADLKKEKTDFVLSNTKYRFRTVDDKGMAEFSFDLILNTQTGKWKISEL